MDDLKELRLFLIRIFLRTVLVVSVAEIILFALLSRTVLPFVLHYFFNDADPGSVSIFGIFLLAIVVLGSVIVELLRLVVPGRAGQLIVSLGDRFNVITGSIMGVKDNALSDMGKLKSTVLFFILFFCIIIVLIPFVLGAAHFARIVIKEFKNIEEREKAKQREYERKRNLMLSDIAHDLRTPMTTVSGYAKALSDNMVPDERKGEYLKAIGEKTERMNELINFLFDYVKTDSEGFTLDLKKTDICELVRECGAFYYQDIEDAGSKLTVSIPEEEYLIKADKLQLSRVINNLLTNALRHNEKGTDLGLFVIKDEDEIKVIVADNGDLIDKEKADHIFEPFYTADESRSSKGGTGLGLSIAENIIKMHGFKIRLKQKPDLGRIDEPGRFNKAFIIRIPLKED